jgi:hypothetical protein
MAEKPFACTLWQNAKAFEEETQQNIVKLIEDLSGKKATPTQGEKCNSRSRRN